jgi:uncharacterized protein (DUF433 family)
VADESDLVRAARWVIEEATAPVDVGERHSRHSYVLVPLQCVKRLEEAMTPEQRSPMPFVSAAPGMKWGEPVIAARRLGALDMADRYWHLGEHAETEILEPYELRRADLLVACWYAVEHGPRRWKQRWGAWVSDLWKRSRFPNGDDVGTGWYSPEWTDVPWPPTRKQMADRPREGEREH